MCSLGQVHDLEALCAYHSQLVFEEVNIERFGRDEKVFVQPEPLRSLSEKRSERAPLSILYITPQNGFQDPEQ